MEDYLGFWVEAQADSIKPKDSNKSDQDKGKGQGD